MATVVAAALAALLVTVGPALAAAPAAAPVTLERLAGGERATLQQLGPSVAILWSTWCPGCTGLAAQVGRLRGALPAGTRIIAVNFQESRPEVERFANAHPFGIDVYLDSEARLFKAARVVEVPALVAIDQTGAVIAKAPLSEAGIAQISKSLR